LKGAPQVILPLCKVDEETSISVEKKVESLSSKGCRTLAVAKSAANDMERLSLVGLLPLADSPRPDSKETIEALKELGVKTKMLTGDNAAIAK
jgi:H+-transporting ATPase